METLQTVFSNREIAYGFWVIIIVLIILASKVYSSFVNVIKNFFANKLTVIYICMLLYTIIEVWIIYKMKLWNLSLIKDTTLWFVTFSFLTLFKSTEAKSFRDFIPIINDIFKLTIFIEFVTNFSSFGLITEIIMLPIITFIGALNFLSEKDNNKKLSTFLSNTLSIIGLVYFSFSLIQTLTNYSKFNSFENLNLLILPVILSLLIIPFFYLIALYNQYEQIFLRVKFMTKNIPNQNKIKRDIILKAKLNLNTVALLRDKLIDFDMFETNDIKPYLDKIKSIN